MDITGKLLAILPEQTGQGKNGPWVKQPFVIEVPHAKYPKKACFVAWGDQADTLKEFPNGANLHIFFDIESREHNERWYTDLRAWKIEMAGMEGSSNSHGSSKKFGNSDEGSDDGMPF